MLNETELRLEGVRLLLKGLGDLDTERFISIINEGNFDYTAWHQNIFGDKSIDELHQLARP